MSLPGLESGSCWLFGRRAVSVKPNRLAVHPGDPTTARSIEPDIQEYRRPTAGDPARVS